MSEPRDGELPQRVYLAQWTAWWAAGLTVVSVVQLSMFAFAFPMRLRSGFDPRLSILFLLFPLLFVASLYMWAGFLIRARRRAGDHDRRHRSGADPHRPGVAGFEC